VILGGFKKGYFEKKSPLADFYKGASSSIYVLLIA
jgi:hypothetical protein